MGLLNQRLNSKWTCDKRWNNGRVNATRLNSRRNRLTCSIKMVAVVNKPSTKGRWSNGKINHQPTLGVVYKGQSGKFGMLANNFKYIFCENRTYFI